MDEVDRKQQDEIEALARKNEEQDRFDRYTLVVLIVGTIWVGLITMAIISMSVNTKVITLKIEPTQAAGILGK